MAVYAFQITIVKHGLKGYVEAESPEEARAKIRDADWDMDYGLTEPTYYTTTINGKVIKVED